MSKWEKEKPQRAAAIAPTEQLIAFSSMCALPHLLCMVLEVSLPAYPSIPPKAMLWIETSSCGDREAAE